MSLAAVAKTLRVSLVSVGRWRQLASDGGTNALATKPQSGRPSKLDASERNKIADLLLHGPKHHGSENDLSMPDCSPR